MAEASTIQSLADEVFGVGDDTPGLARKKFNEKYLELKAQFVQVFGEELKPLDIMKGDADYDRELSKKEFVDWASAQDFSKEGIERPWERSAEQLADLLYAGKPEGLTHKEFAAAYKERQQTFDTLFQGILKYGDFYKGDTDGNRLMSKEEFIIFAKAQKRSPGIEAPERVECTAGALADMVYGSGDDVPGLGRKDLQEKYVALKPQFVDVFGEELSPLDFMKGDTDYDREVSKAEFLKWANNQDKSNPGIERPWEMKAEKLADLIYEEKPNGLTQREFSKAYSARKETFQTLFKAPLKFSDFYKGDTNGDKIMSKEEFIAFAKCQDRRPGVESPEATGEEEVQSSG